MPIQSCDYQHQGFHESIVGVTYVYIYIHFFLPAHIYICIYINTFTDTGAILGIYEILGNLDKSCSKLLLLDD